MFEGLFQPMHLLLILGIALLIFGPKRLPELGKGLGSSIRDFKDAMTGKPDDKASTQLEAPKASVAATPSNAPAAGAPAPTLPANAPPTAANSAPPQGPGGGSQA
ncbi:MAG: twin-arginine translocase TatA/TatE family subunit [Acidobacteria bacterium]|nr:twin-arginine translocase TatA/TatE family subunit [Acidobacteriota bacterium]